MICIEESLILFAYCTTGFELFKEEFMRGKDARKKYLNFSILGWLTC